MNVVEEFLIKKVGGAGGDGGRPMPEVMQRTNVNETVFGKDAAFPRQ